MALPGQRDPLRAEVEDLWSSPSPTICGSHAPWPPRTGRIYSKVPGRRLVRVMPIRDRAPSRDLAAVVN